MIDAGGKKSLTDSINRGLGQRLYDRSRIVQSFNVGRAKLDKLGEVVDTSLEVGVDDVGVDVLHGRHDCKRTGVLE